MSLFKRNQIWWVRFTAPDGTRIRQSAKTDSKRHAQEFHDELKAQYWRESQLGEQRQYSWQEAVIRFVNETNHKASHDDDLASFRWLDPHLGQLTLSDINRDVIDQLMSIRRDEGVSNATVNRTLALVRCVLRKAEREWEWIAKAPYVRMLPEPKRRIRWLTQNEAQLLIQVLPPHLKSLVRFSLATGLRKSNATGLMWSQVDMARRIAWIHADQAKARRSISVPLNKDALDVIRSQIGKHDEFIFTYQGKPIQQVNTKAWKNALRKAGIQDFRWHDLRHTWASWHVQNGTPLAVLQELGGWESSEMVRKYAHLSHEHMAGYADNLCLPSDPGSRFGTNLAQSPNLKIEKLT